MIWPQITGIALLLAALIASTQLARKPPSLPEDWHHGAFMEIFVRSYKDSNGDGIGDLKGLTQSLDHLKDLGIKGIWLMPITTSADMATPPPTFATSTLTMAAWPTLMN